MKTRTSRRSNRLRFFSSNQARRVTDITNREHEHDLKPVSGAVYGFVGAGAPALIVGLAAFAVPRPAGALPAYAQQTGLACGRCHVNPAGGGPRTSFGNAFTANGHKVPAKPAKVSEPTKMSEPVKPGTASIPGGVRSAPWAAPRRCNGWCLRRD